MLAKKTSKNQLTLPKKILEEIPDTDYFDVTIRQGTPMISRPILEEYLRVLAYPKFRLTAKEIRSLIEEELLPYTETVHVKTIRRTLARDPEDAKFIESALAGDVP